MTTAFLRDTGTAFSREFVPYLRQPFIMLFTMGQPLLFLILFGSLLAGTPGFAGQGEGSAWQWFVPGILVMMCLSGPLMAGYSLLMELAGGSMERMLVTPMNRTAMLIGRTAKEFAILLVQALLLIGLSLPLGFRSSPAGILAGLALLVVFGVGLGSLSFVLAIVSRPGGELFWLVTQVTLFPLMLLSGMLLPVDSGPGWMRAVAAVNPVYYITEAERALFAGRFTEMPVLYGGLAAAAVAVIGLALGTRAMRRGV
ncbi:ABC transporter permease [Sphaerisporangium sp. TRM90804]|uniref:ABC transporter permease n=1 Tax=Sphaerisporangium sp. TRM90804 TaxID=3031113 RepID=UPI0024472EB7|nr:ABC transporter permease [Sphaerisporangium sp. TRM90804]MDH2429912.1 ABC transporter permease [Sphaerisporangium sp. TRM90804]